MSVSGELLCSFELLKPLDSSALKRHIKKGRNERQNMLNSPVSCHVEIWCENKITDPVQPASQYPQSY
jgi:serine/threonine-protein phosphatase PP1 catalytic subunit